MIALNMIIYSLFSSFLGNLHLTSISKSVSTLLLASIGKPAILLIVAIGLRSFAQRPLWGIEIRWWMQIRTPHQST